MILNPVTNKFVQKFGTVGKVITKCLEDEKDEITRKILEKKLQKKFNEIASTSSFSVSSSDIKTINKPKSSSSIEVINKPKSSSSIEVINKPKSSSIETINESKSSSIEAINESKSSSKIYSNVCFFCKKYLSRSICSCKRKKRPTMKSSSFSLL